MLVEGRDSADHFVVLLALHGHTKDELDQKQHFGIVMSSRHGAASAVLYIDRLRIKNRLIVAVVHNVALHEGLDRVE